MRGSVALGLLFGLNIPACAAPLILTLFGAALSLPLVLAVFFAPARRALDALAALSRRVPRWTGMLLLALGLWSIWFALFASIQPP